MTRRTIVKIVIVIALPVIAYAALYFSPGRRFFRNYNGLTVGMTETEVRHLLGGAPDFECTYRGLRILYFLRDAHPNPIPSAVTEKEQIPSIYGAAQILLGRDGKVLAFTWNGEELAIHTIRGDFPGAWLSQLDDAFFD